MDALDRRLLGLIERSPRITYRSLADRLGVSVTTVQRRTEGLMASGRFGPIRGRLSLRSLGGSTVLIHGSAEEKLTPGVMDGLGDNGSIKLLSRGMFDHLYCHSQIRRPEDVDELVAFLEERVGLRDPQVLVVRKGMFLRGGFEERTASTERPPEPRSSDLRIVRSLSSDGRKSITAISKETGLSARTVKRRLNEMMSNGTIEFDIGSNLTLEGDIMFSLLVEFGSVPCRDECMRMLVNDVGGIFDAVFLFLDAPQVLLMEGMVGTPSELSGLIDFMLQQDDVVKIRPDVIIKLRSFDTWANRISQGETVPAGKASSRSPAGRALRGSQRGFAYPE